MAWIKSRAVVGWLYSVLEAGIWNAQYNRDALVKRRIALERVRVAVELGFPRGRGDIRDEWLRAGAK